MSYHHGNLHDSLLQHGEDALREGGFENLSLRSIAKRAGVSHNAPYRHFRDKDDLIDQILEKAMLQLAEQILAAALLYPGSLTMQIQFVGRLFAQLALREPRKAHLMFTGLGTNQTFEQTLRASHRLVVLNISSLIDEAFHNTSGNPETKVVALQLYAAYRGLSTMLTSKTLPEDNLGEDEIFDLFDSLTQNLLHRILDSSKSLT